MLQETAMETYLNWIKANGGTFKKIEFKHDSLGVGCVYTTQTVQEDENFATVPFKLCITENLARKALPDLGSFSGRIVQTLYLLLQRHSREDSFYWPYINILPKVIKTPLVFDDHDMRFIQNTNLESTTRERKAALFLDFEKLLEHLPEEIDKNDITWEDFLWGYSVFSSRSFPYTLIDPTFEGSSEVLFPLVDALNHKPNTKITWSRNGDPETGSLSFVAGQAINAGEEIFNNYGPKYNEFDHVAVKPNFSQDPNQETKLNILKQCQVSSDNADPLVFYFHRNNMPRAFFKLMRVLVMNSLETEHYAMCTDGNLLDFVGYRNEITMISMTLSLFKSKLYALKSVQLEKEHIPYWQTFALMYRAGQEDILDITIKKVEEMKHSLIQQMHQEEKEDKIAPCAPFLSIVNPLYFQQQDSSIELTSNEFVTLDTVVMTAKRVLNNDATFAAIISENFEPEEEADIIMMLCLVRENSKPDSRFRRFFDRVTAAQSNSVTSAPATDAAAEDRAELKEMYDSMIPAFHEAYPDVFDLKVFSFEAFVWADMILNSYSIENPLAIVPL
ncbi:hypothetical protein [Parasitella parasitica]|uniref:SET domain-containing protein n=1 Tax=Parasitella parasitica TaxID=35722 RepID=A0A0B7NL33_9FUNG|nr:hypothetical protein [Parasitella parasitica]